MRSAVRFTPKQIAALSLGGALLITLNCVVCILCHPAGTLGHSSLPFGALLLSPALMGSAVMLWGQRSLRLGILDDLWPRIAVESLGARLRSRPVSWTLQAFTFLCLAVGCVPLLFTRSGPHNWGFLLYPMLMPTGCRTELLRILAPSREPAPLLKDAKPLVSSHWGRR